MSSLYHNLHFLPQILTSIPHLPRLLFFQFHGLSSSKNLETKPETGVNFLTILM